DDRELAIFEIRIVRFQQLRDVSGRMTLGQHVEHERIDAPQIESLRLAHAHVGTQALVAPAAREREGGGADAEAPGVRATRDDRVRHDVSRFFLSMSANSMAGRALRGWRARSS